MTATCEDGVRKPNFFTVGAARCGTSAMYEYLRAHPEIYIPDRKELYYFSRDLHFVHPRPSLDEYLAQFAKARDEKRLGDASPLALYSKTAAQEIKEFSPDARIIIMLRNPVEEMYSHHSQLLFTGDENIEDFEQALAAEEPRKQGRIPYRGTICPEVLFYREGPRFAAQVKRYFDAFGRNNVHVNIFDDFKRDTAAVYRDTLQFLEVDPLFRPQLDAVNANKVYRSKALRRFFNAPVVRTAARTLLPKPVRARAQQALTPLVARHAKRPPMDPNLRRCLQDEFREDVQNLSDILGRNLLHWCSQP